MQKCGLVAEHVFLHTVLQQVGVLLGKTGQTSLDFVLWQARRIHLAHIPDLVTQAITAQDLVEIRLRRLPGGSRNQGVEQCITRGLL